MISPAALERTKTLLRALGYELSAAPMRFASGVTVHQVSRVVGREVMTVDLLLAEGPLAEVLEDRETLRWEHRPVSVVSRRALVAMKRLAGRPQDLADLAALGEDP